MKLAFNALDSTITRADSFYQLQPKEVLVVLSRVVCLGERSFNQDEVILLNLADQICCFGG
jgi:hypothetical protein